jgi:hypothetical protein
MIEQIINGINYRLDEETKTAEVIPQEIAHEGDLVIPEIVVFQEVSYCVTSIGDCAIYECPSLKSVIIGNSVTSIGEEALGHCPLLRSVTFNGTIEQWGNVDLAFGWNDYVELVHCTDGDVEI